MKIYRERLSFTKDELTQRSTVGLLSGVRLAMPDEKEKIKRIQEHFGLFGGSSDSDKFYPGLNVIEDLMPKPEDFIDIPFRLISATIVAGGSWRSTDFSNADVLKASTGKLDMKPLYKDHDTDTANWVGLVKNPVWGEGYTSATGLSVPGGIDAILSIDGKTNPKIARGVLVGAIGSNSVTVEFDWVKSHDFKSDNEFLEKIGTYDKDGKMVTRKVTNVIDYHESSLCWLGADPFAKRKDESGNLVNIEEGSVVEYSKLSSFTKDLYEKDKKYFVSTCLGKDERISLGKEYKFLDPKHPEEMIINAAALLALATVFGKTEAELATLTEEDVKKLALKKEGFTEVDNAVYNSLKLKATKAEENETKVVSLESEKTALETAKVALETEKNTLAAKVTELTPLAESGKNFLAMKLAEVKRLYNLSVTASGGTADPKVLKLYDEAAPDALEGLLAQYTKGVKVMFKGHCKSCNSDDITFQSSLNGGADDIDHAEGVVKPIDVSMGSIADKFTDKKFGFNK